MKLVKVFVFFAILLLAVSCAPKTDKASESSLTADTKAVITAEPTLAPADIKDPEAWATLYDALIAAYSEASARANAGNPAALTEAENISKQADALNAAADAIAAGLTGQAQTDFAAKVEEYKEKFKAAASS